MLTVETSSWIRSLGQITPPKYLSELSEYIYVRWYRFVRVWSRNRRFAATYALLDTSARFVLPLILLLEGLLLYPLVVAILGTIGGEAVLLYSFYLVVLTLLAETVWLLNGRLSVDYLHYLVRMVVERNLDRYFGVVYNLSYLESHLEGVIRLGNNLMRGFFGDFVRIGFRYAGYSQQAVPTIDHIDESISLGIAYRAGRMQTGNVLEPLREYREAFQKSLAPTSQTPAGLADFLIQQYKLVPQEVSDQVRTDYKARVSLVEWIEEHIEVAKLLVYIFAVLAVFVAASIFGLMVPLP